MNFIGIIPARYASTRFPGKPLVDIGGKTMIQRVYEQSAKALQNVVVATDDERIKTTVEQFGGNVVLTSPNHKSGTDRCAEAVTVFENKNNQKFDVIINIQGDEPFIEPEQLITLKNCFSDESTQIATLVMPFESNDDIFNPNLPKVILNINQEAIYFSRSPIPYIRNEEKNNWINHLTFYKHIGIYAYKKEILHTITKLQLSKLELAESLEQNRWIENGYKIKTAVTRSESISIDTPEDLEKALNVLKL